MSGEGVEGNGCNPMIFMLLSVPCPSVCPVLSLPAPSPVRDEQTLHSAACTKDVAQAMQVVV